MPASSFSPAVPVDVLLIGGGVMSATLGTLIQQLEPTWSIQLIERLDSVALEASDPWNNAGTGHAALCELNYTPEAPDGSIDVTKAVSINEQFHVSREFWEWLSEHGVLPDGHWIQDVPHLTFVRGQENVEFLRRRHEALAAHPAFASMKFTSDPAIIADWAPLLTEGRASGEPLAATYSAEGTDIDFGALTRYLVAGLTAGGADVRLRHEVKSLRRSPGQGWLARVVDRATGQASLTPARFVFVGAGGGALPLLQSAGIPEARGYGGFPVSGHFLRTDSPKLLAQHQAKVYGKADLGAPPMSLPHLDTRWIDGQQYLMFGPFAGFSPRYLKHGLPLGLLTSLRTHNALPMAQAGLANLDLTRYLIGEVLARPAARIEALRGFVPTADATDWEWFKAGQRVQIIKRNPATGKGTLEFGTEVVASNDGTIAGLLGASPGASVAVSAMIELLQRCFPTQATRWHPKLKQMIPSLRN
ncbi:MAG: malate dehydrogenase (quinone) [Promicromonosporaceae bacterium]|nr:malate dehydrogenase (quinone) [Promicromonosporaceae bacterium]